MNLNFNEILSPKIIKHCLPLYLEGHYDSASHKAMLQVELALKEKAGITGADSKKLYGRFLIKELFSNSEDKGNHKKSVPVKLRVPLGDELQEEAERMFSGVFAYYRNYCAHDGRKITKGICLRIMVIASELLDLIDASSLSYEDIGGVEEILKFGNFKNSLILYNLLKFLENTWVIDDSSFYEDLYKSGFTDFQFKAMIDLDLVRYEINEANEDFDTNEFIEIGSFVLTDLGKKVVREIEIIENISNER
ncbi:TIGR02391 family protein [Thermoanaerobacter uzonensis DSM 18761]|uniref:TIGR02391 family protein n=1 Tax=Thermoanaerobacter uzonensis DSM 18761 TaxID=1123369 RepID=A0A1M5B6L4_9THEO|nr:TIGR02391 family protein [Thermoanaerobacter uzonensis]SHF38098.1 TIGR02391 family protein [Thermoanaerobacter uzonensis DSM 18761]